MNATGMYQYLALLQDFVLKSSIQIPESVLSYLSCITPFDRSLQFSSVHMVILRVQESCQQKSPAKHLVLPGFTLCDLNTASLYRITHCLKRFELI
jgi:hypothetical protein